MWRRALRALVVMSAAAVLASAAPIAPAVDVVLRPVVERGGFVAVDFAVTFNGEADGETVLRLPDTWAGEADLWKALGDLRIDGAQLQAGEGPGQRTLRHAPGARITAHYRVRQETTGAPTVGGRNPYRPLVQPEWFHFIGETVLALPDSVDMRAPARLHAEGLPSGAIFASDAEHLGLEVRDLVESVMVGGDFRIIDAGGGLRIALRGVWPHDDATWRSQLARIGADQRAYWGAGRESYLVTVLPVSGEPEEVSAGGTGRGDGFAFFATANAPMPMITSILSHEMMHTWIPGRIGGLPAKDEAADYWFSEGFTDWASWRVNVRGGLWTPEDFAAAFNRSVEAYDLSPARTAPNTRIVQDFWSDGALQKLPYQRGMLIAALWDYRLRMASHGAHDLDDVQLRMQRGAVRRPDLSAVQLLPEAMRRVAGVEVAVDRTTLVAEGQVVELPRDLYAPCGDVIAEQKAMWVRGFDFQATLRSGQIVTGVIEGSAAWRAGLRNGMRLVAWQEHSDALDASVPVTAGVVDNGVRRDIAWLPTDGRTRTVRRLVLRSGFDRAACVRLLAGLPAA
jgi:predicted metalloprotease with PDZ domain